MQNLGERKTGRDLAKLQPLWREDAGKTEGERVPLAE